MGKREEPRWNDKDLGEDETEVRWGGGVGLILEVVEIRQRQKKKKNRMVLEEKRLLCLHWVNLGEKDATSPRGGESPRTTLPSFNGVHRSLLLLGVFLVVFFNCKEKKSLLISFTWLETFQPNTKKTLSTLVFPPSCESCPL